MGMTQRPISATWRLIKEQLPLQLSKADRLILLQQVQSQLVEMARYSWSLRMH
ncbi:Hypothetical predicted protein [Podarcis lilfordi]|uniref:Uncharacterized protein n=1 Tax=Podarcis lilfordi TaxID=74358 RepID=A0AA35PSR8_9SAUR|nr:Hypothetical predicted protein [Podarcis lilfordi]